MFFNNQVQQLSLISIKVVIELLQKPTAFFNECVNFMMPYLVIFFLGTSLGCETTKVRYHLPFM